MATQTAVHTKTTPGPPTQMIHMPQDISPIKRFDSSADPVELAKILKDDGAVIIQGFLSEDQVQRFNAETQAHLDAYPSYAEAVGIPEELKDFNGRQTRRMCITDVSRTARDEILNSDLIHSVCEEVITKGCGCYWLSSAQMMEIGPGNPAQPLHRDAANWWPFLHMGPSAPQCYLNFLIAFSDTTTANGATRFIPGSNKWPYGADFSNCGKDEWAMSIELKKGDMLIIDDRIVHGGGHNSTKDEFRKIVSLAVTNGAFTQEEAFTLTLDVELVKTLPERLQRFLGFRSQYPKGSAGLMTKDAKDVALHLGL